jgi:hypothetical protein
MASENEKLKHFNEWFYASHFAAMVLTSYIYGDSFTELQGVKTVVDETKDRAKNTKIGVRGFEMDEADTFNFLLQCALLDTAKDYVIKSEQSLQED